MARPMTPPFTITITFFNTSIPSTSQPNAVIDLAPEVRLLRQKNAGKAASLNAGLALVNTACPHP